ncbi:hypothetical protein GCM10010519_51220 [Streptomyces lactacystinicus]
MTAVNREPPTGLPAVLALAITAGYQLAGLLGEPAPAADSCAVVAALTDGAATVERLEREDGRIRPMPHTSAYGPINGDTRPSSARSPQSCAARDGRPRHQLPCPLEYGYSGAGPSRTPGVVARGETEGPECSTRGC